jgi:hypothetical protein
VDKTGNLIQKLVKAKELPTMGLRTDLFRLALRVAIRRENHNRDAGTMSTPTQLLGKRGPFLVGLICGTQGKPSQRLLVA